MTTEAGQQILGAMGYRFAVFTISQALIDAQGKEMVVDMCKRGDNLPAGALLREYPLQKTEATEPNQFTFLPCLPEQATHWHWEFVWTQEGS